MSDSPVIHSVTRRAGIAGQFAVECVVQYPEEPRSTVTFTGSSYGGPVVMTSDSLQTFVTDPGRFGTFGTDWARKFFAAA